MHLLMNSSSFPNHEKYIKMGASLPPCLFNSLCPVAPIGAERNEIKGVPLRSLFGGPGDHENHQSANWGFAERSAELPKQHRTRREDVRSDRRQERPDSFL